MAAPVGNRFGERKQRLWRETLVRKCGQDPNALERIALKVIAMAEAGDMQAIKEIGDRLDGKPMQQVDISGQMTMQQAYKDLPDEALLAIATQARQENEGETLQ